ncbi:MAG: hypothetical protein Hals2KO_02660 [Halioglobus sp.]
MLDLYINNDVGVNMNNLYGAALALAISILFAQASWAGNPALEDPHTLVLGAFFQNSDSKISSTRTGSESRELDLEGLGADDQYVSFMAGYQWRFAERWALLVTGYTFNADGSSVIEDTFTFDGEEFEAGASLETEISVDTLLVDVLFSLYKSDNAEFRLGGGLHAFRFDVEFQASAFVGENSVSGSVADEQLLAPLPNLRADATLALSPRWSIYGGVGWLSAEVDDYDGSYVFANARTDFRVTDRFAVGIGYRLVDTDVTYTSSRREVVFNTTYDGPTAYLTYSF